jgi:CMP-N,N'-diacetyllegionaminic acid synthase
MNILITICARGGSKGIPGKNIRPIGGQPLIVYTINMANKIASRMNAKVALSTENSEIKDVANHYGLYSDYIRPDEFAGDKAGKIDTIKDLIDFEEKKYNTRFDYILDLDVTSPLRTIHDIHTSFDDLLKAPEALTIFSVNPAARNPYFNMVEKKGNGFYDLIKKNEDGTVLSRQVAPPVYDLNASFYWYKRDFFDLNLKSPITNKSLVFAMDHLCFDLDHPIDFDFLDYLVNNKKITFDFQ